MNEVTQHFVEWISQLLTVASKQIVTIVSRKHVKSAPYQNKQT